MKYKYVYVGFAKKHWMEAEIDEDEFDISKLKIVKSKLLLPPSSYLDTESDIFSIYYGDKELFDRDAPWNCVFKIRYGFSRSFIQSRVNPVE